MLDSRAAGFREDVRVGCGTGADETCTSDPPHSAASSFSGAAGLAERAAGASSSTAPLRSTLRGNALRQALSTATRVSDLN
eukprot:912672-Pleurochrysis_carterae.AAC.1